MQTDFLETIEQPAGTVTLVFTDIEGSTRLLTELGQDAYQCALVEHRGCVREAFRRHRGYEVDVVGDGFFYAFASAVDAVQAVREAVACFEAGPIRIRVGIHTGRPGLYPPNYLGLDVHKAARITAAGHGGQVLLSEATRELVADRFPLRYLGEYRLKDISPTEHLYQLGLGDFPAMMAPRATNASAPQTPFRCSRVTQRGRRLEAVPSPRARCTSRSRPRCF
jgi:class 3 adenylate cyclase